MPSVFPRNILGLSGRSTPTSILGGGSGSTDGDASAWHVCYTLPMHSPGFHEVVSISSDLGVYWMEVTGWIQCGSWMDRVGICCLVTRNSIERIGLNHESDLLLISIAEGTTKLLIPQQTNELTYSLRIGHRYLTKPRPIVSFATIAGRDVVPIA